jgi:hypothetical protein
MVVHHTMLGSLSGWDWVDISGVILVLIGVAGAWWTRTRKTPLYAHEIVRHRHAEHGFESVLVIGLAIELAAVPHHILESSNLKKMAGEANERASTNELRVAELEKESAQLRAVGEKAKEAAARATEEAEKARKEREVAEAGRLSLQAKVLELEQHATVLAQNQQWRTISEKQSGIVISGLKSLPRWPVVIQTVIPDAETSNYYWSIVNLFTSAEYPHRLKVTERGFNIRQLRDGLGIVSNPTNLASRDILLTLFHTSGIPVWPGYSESLTNVEIHVGKKPIEDLK